VLQNGLRSFPGLAHRMEQVGRRGKVLFVNDSKGTNADAAAHALSSFPDIFWIAGGKPKLGGISGLAEYFPRLRKAYLIGEAAQEFAATLDGKAAYEISKTLDVAVASAARDAEASDVADPVVLLSPACASACAIALGASGEVLQNGLRSFPGLAHRMEQVGRRDNVLFVNDSKGTNADAAAHALSSFADIFWIAGGKPKLGGISGLVEYFPRIRKAYLIGEAAAEFAGTLGDRVPHELSQTLDVAVASAARDAAASGIADPVVLLSPACASFDQYRNFEIRGTKFRELVVALPGVKPIV
jgi:UDP-N-acetylmuramoylalanine-D-glutamate ligase